MEERFERALEAIDRANQDDPNRIVLPHVSGPKELVHGRMVSDWIERLHPEASFPLRLAGRAHHLERWTLPRKSYPDGRKGYLRWRTALQDHHVKRARQILAAEGFPEEELQRVEDILRKRNLRRDREVQCFEDALCLVFLETQFRILAERLGDEKMVEVLRRTLPKMSPDGKQAATSLALGDSERALLTRALQAP